MDRMHPAASGLQPTVTVYAVYQAGIGMVARHDAHNVARRITRINVTGIAGSQVRVYRDAISPISLIDSNNVGSANTAEYANPIPLRQGNAVIVVWPGVQDTNNVTTATFFQEPM